MCRHIAGLLCLKTFFEKCPPFSEGVLKVMPLALNAEIAGRFHSLSGVFEFVNPVRRGAKANFGHESQREKMLLFLTLGPAKQSRFAWQGLLHLRIRSQCCQGLETLQQTNLFVVELSEALCAGSGACRTNTRGLCMCSIHIGAPQRGESRRVP